MFKSRRRGLRLLALMGTALLVVTGCHSVTGGGWGNSVVQGGSGSNQKTTFGFSIQCDPRRNVIRGQFEYQDKPANVKVHASLKPVSVEEISEGEVDTCQELDALWNAIQNNEQLPPPLDIPGETVFFGEYKPQVDVSQDGGILYVNIFDGTIQGCRKGDAFLVALLGGVYGGYTNAVCLDLGTIKVRA